jgi:hypothetical protein
MPATTVDHLGDITRITDPVSITPDAFVSALTAITMARRPEVTITVNDGRLSADVTGVTGDVDWDELIGEAVDECIDAAPKGDPVWLDRLLLAGQAAVLAALAWMFLYHVVLA